MSGCGRDHWSQIHIYIQDVISLSLDKFVLEMSKKT